MAKNERFFHPLGQASRKCWQNPLHPQVLKPSFFYPDEVLLLALAKLGVCGSDVSLVCSICHMWRRDCCERQTPHKPLETEIEWVMVLLLALFWSEACGSSLLPWQGKGGFEDFLQRLNIEIEDIFWKNYIVSFCQKSAVVQYDEQYKWLLGKPHEKLEAIVVFDALGASFQKTFLQESLLINGLMKYINRPSITRQCLDLLDSDLIEVENSPYTLNELQKKALRLSVTEPFLLLSGGPGTGKTSVVMAILRLALRMGVAVEGIVLCAPTGKAAHRMAESLQKGLKQLAGVAHKSDEILMKFLPEPQTLHRLLGYSPTRGTFRHHKTNSLSAKIIIVDEASMVDLFLFEKLVAALPGDSQLILLGDADQLPSVDTGAVLRDLFIWPHVPPQRKVILQESYRMNPKDPAGRHVYLTSRLIKEGQELNLSDDQENLSDDQDEIKIKYITRHNGCMNVNWAGVEFLEMNHDPHLFKEYVAQWADYFLKPGEWQKRFRHVLVTDSCGLADDQLQWIKDSFLYLERCRFLCCTKQGRFGVENTNALVMNQLGYVENTWQMQAGVPLMIILNDYDKGLFNGDQGLTFWMKQNGRKELMALFPRENGYAIFPFVSLQSIVEIAWAFTVHKSQGSEFQHVTLLLPHADSDFNTREILYTGLTRAKTSVVLIGQQGILQAAVSRKLLRHSRMSVQT